MKAKEIRKKTIDELNKLESEMLAEVFNLRIQKATGQINKTDQINKVRKNLARIYTILSEKIREEKL